MAQQPTPPSRAFRYYMVCGGIVLLVALLATYKHRQFAAFAEMGKLMGPGPESVSTVVVQAEDWHPTIRAVGSLSAVQGVVLAAELPGLVREIHFQSGATVAAGDLLVKLDTEADEAQLDGALASEVLARLNLERAKDLVSTGTRSQADLDAAEAQCKQAQAAVRSIRASISKKAIAAPFAGRTGIRQVNIGQFVNPGTPIVSLQSLDPIYIDFTLPQQELARVAVGQEVRVLLAGQAEAFPGRINAINPDVSESTRNFRIQATLANAAEKLRPGMFATVEVVLPTVASVLTVPATAISYNPYGNAVFVIEQMKDPLGKEYLGSRQQFIKLGATRGDQVAVLSGLKAGEVVASSGVFKLRNGGAVAVNNEVSPSNNPAPTPPNS